ncbi:uncharacterized protein Dana_GF26381, partial [Drosophila ananassae]
MKWLAFLCLIFTVLKAVLSLKNPICGEHPEVNSFVEGQNCLALLENFSYHKATDECKPFIYGGCGGNENNFETKNECEDKCKVK